MNEIKKITKKWLDGHGICKESYEWFFKQKETDVLKLYKKALKDDHYDWVNWTMCRSFNRRQKIQYAVYVVEQVLPIFEKGHPGDKGPRKEIEAAIKCITKDIKENRIFASSTAAAAAVSVVVYAHAVAAKEKMQKKLLEYGMKLLSE